MITTWLLLIQPTLSIQINHLCPVYRCVSNLVTLHEACEKYYSHLARSANYFIFVEKSLHSLSPQSYTARKWTSLQDSHMTQTSNPKRSDKIKDTNAMSHRTENVFLRPVQVLFWVKIEIHKMISLQEFSEVKKLTTVDSKTTMWYFPGAASRNGIIVHSLMNQNICLGSVSEKVDKIKQKQELQHKEELQNIISWVSIEIIRSYFKHFYLVDSFIRFIPTFKIEESVKWSSPKYKLTIFNIFFWGGGGHTVTKLWGQSPKRPQLWFVFSSRPVFKYLTKDFQKSIRKHFLSQSDQWVQLLRFFLPYLLKSSTHMLYK